MPGSQHVPNAYHFGDLVGELPVVAKLEEAARVASIHGHPTSCLVEETRWLRKGNWQFAALCSRF